MQNPNAVFMLLSLVFWLPASAVQAAGKAAHFLLIVWDGMRPDFVSPELTPNLCTLRERGVWLANHHSVYPTLTQVNGTALAKGAFPTFVGVTLPLQSLTRLPF